MGPIYSMISVRQICLSTHLFHKTGTINIMYDHILPFSSKKYCPLLILFFHLFKFVKDRESEMVKNSISFNYNTTVKEK